ncbi:WD40-repeat-containing domain protein [Butyriboletus roseoflavus]|nr:WD40-repeat-containing domain protein [Butyriboletus roseoflavus]
MGASVWDGDMREKVIHVEGTNIVWAIDICADSTRFATGTAEDGASVWSIRSGERLVGPLKHDAQVTGIRFSPNGELVATACPRNYIRIFDSRTGDKLVTIKIDIPSWVGTPLSWSSDGRQIFSTSSDSRIRSFDPSTGSLLSESQILHDGEDVRSIALAANGKFIVAITQHSISFLDIPTLTRIGPVIEDSQEPTSIAISPGSGHLAAGRDDGKIVIYDLSKILPDLCGPFNVSI